MKRIVLENIRSAHNVGAIFRTADAAGVNELFLIGYTPCPIDRFGRIQKEIEKTSLGASTTMNWQHHETFTDIYPTLKSEQSDIIAVEQSPHSVLLKAFVEPSSVTYVFGNEVEGVSPEVLEKADTILEIPMLGAKESLNVSVAVGVVLYHGVCSQ